MARRSSTISLKEADYFCLEKDVNDLDSSIGGLPSDEEQEIDDILADNYERWAGFSFVSAFVSNKVMFGLVDFRYSKTGMLIMLFNRIF